MLYSVYYRQIITSLGLLRDWFLSRVIHRAGACVLLVSSLINSQLIKTKMHYLEEILYIVTNLMYTPGALFSRLFLKICFFVLSLYYTVP